MKISPEEHPSRPRLRLVMVSMLVSCLGAISAAHAWGQEAGAKALPVADSAASAGASSPAVTEEAAPKGLGAEPSASQTTEKTAATPARRDEGVDKESRRHEWPSEGPVGEAFRDAAKELRCPTCTGLSVLESDAAFSVQIKDIVKEQVLAGKSKEQIMAYFTARFGPWILRSPPVSGFNIWAWAVPLGMLLLGPPLLWFFVWRKRRVVDTLGVRPDADIMREMHDRLVHMKAQGQVGKG